ncbi:VanZ family protein [Pseudomonas sp. R5(2019)]|uniref:VanZ family protein n=1 Tax=Pseudomonas sp. R5(2019) TaxID=2697566 RepID=UPI0014123081|nr:VanZ family protein [Pseudomonas sp. R5(2019)]
MTNLFKRLAQLPFWIRASIFIVVSLVLLDAGLRPQPIPQVFEQEDKIHHLVGFMVLSFTCVLAFPRIRLRWVALSCLTVGIAIEAAQELMPLRTASPYDMLANSAGVLLGAMMALRWLR